MAKEDSMNWEDSKLSDWKACISAAEPSVVFETGGSRNSFRIYALLDGRQIGEFVVTKVGSDDSNTFGKGTA
jgi:hypothetical protein